MPPVQEIVDAADVRLADYRVLQDSGLRRRQGLFVAEGHVVVRRLLKDGRFRVRSLLLTPAAWHRLHDLRPRLHGAPAIYVASPGVIRDAVGFDFHRGCLALAERGGELSAERLIAPAGRRALVVLDDLADPDNVGAVFRNAFAFGVDGLLLSAATADPLYRKAIRVSAAATLRVPFARIPDWEGGVRRLRESGYTLLALATDGAVDVADLGRAQPLSGRVAVLVGSEGTGLGTVARRAADLAVRVAMAPGVDSLNVATACGIALHRLRGADLRS
jgi:tRNA G18 (ribose-2'-O)-methylase SpoU